MRKIILIICIFVVLFSVSACFKRKTNVDISQGDKATIVVESTDAHPGDEVLVPIRFVKSPGIAACRLIIEYDSNNLKLKSVNYGQVFIENGEEISSLDSPLILAWSQLDDFKGDEVFANLTFVVNNDAKIFNKYSINVRYSASDLININEEEVEFNVENGYVSIIK